MYYYGDTSYAINAAVDNVTIDMANNRIDGYIFNNLDIGSDAKFILDIDAAHQKADTIRFFGNDNLKILTIDNLNGIVDYVKLNQQYKIKIIEDRTYSNTEKTQLALTARDEYLLGTDHVFINDAG